jgi:radical SAM protein with 4Fe4S-binding SPASM domain
MYHDSKKWIDELDVLTATLPRDLGAEINNVCNANCSFCGYGKGDGGKAADPRAKRKLRTEVFRHTIKIFSESGGGKFSLSPILGEVSADKRWLDFVREARAYPNITGVTCFTNAILLHRFGSEEILTSGLSNISVSCSLGSAEQYQRLYGVDKYDQVVFNILDLLRTNKRLGHPVYIHLQLRIDKPFSDFYDCDLYAELLTLVSPSDIIVLDDLWDDYRGVIPESQLPKGHKLLENVQDKSIPCYAMYRKLQVMMDGTLQACACRVEPELWGGNIMDYNSLEKAWRDPGLEKLRSDWHNGEISECCQQCTHYHPYTDLLKDSTLDAVMTKVRQKISQALTGS